MRYAALFVAAAGCGRLGFDGRPGADGATADTAADAPPRDVPSDVLRYFPFDEAPSPGIHNLAPAGADAACLTTCPAATAGQRGGAYEFDGGADAVVFPDATDLRGASGGVALWVRLDSPPLDDEFRQLLGRPYMSNSSNSWELFFYKTPGGPIQLMFGGDSVVSGVYAQVPFTGAGAWTHIAANWGPATTEIYVNGVRVAQAGPFPMAFDTDEASIGADYDGVYRWFIHGALDEIVLMGRPFTPAEIAALAAQ